MRFSAFAPMFTAFALSSIAHADFATDSKVGDIVCKGRIGTVRLHCN